MSARSVCSGTDPATSRSRRDISEPPRRPEMTMRTPFAPRCIERWAACLIARRNATRRSICSATERATSSASSSGWRISWMLRRTFLPVFSSRSLRSSSTLAPDLPITMPGLAVWIVTVTWFADRSMSMRGTPASCSRLRISERMSRSSCRSRSGLSCVPLAGAPFVDHDRDMARSAQQRAHPAVGARPPALQHPRLVRPDARHVQVVGVEAVVVLRVGDRRLDRLEDLTRGLLRHELELRHRAVDGHATDCVDDEPHLPRCDPDVARVSVDFHGGSPSRSLLLDAGGPLGRLPAAVAAEVARRSELA